MSKAISKLYFIHILSALHNQIYSKVIEAWVHLSEEPNMSKICFDWHIH